MIPMAMLVGALGACWLIRVGNMYVALRDTAWDYRQEWTRDEANAAVGQNPIVASLRAAALKRVPADPRRDPLWTYKIFQRRYEPALDEPAR